MVSRYQYVWKNGALVYFYAKTRMSRPKFPESDPHPHSHVTQIGLFLGSVTITNHMESDRFKSDLGQFQMWF